MQGRENALEERPGNDGAERRRASDSAVPAKQFIDVYNKATADPLLALTQALAQIQARRVLCLRGTQLVRRVQVGD